MPEMMNITVRNKIATKTDNVAYVCGNSDYVINFDFDSEWDAYDTKTARFAHDGQHTDVVFSGNQCNAPIITNTYAFHVGVYAGDLHTTTAARVPCRKSILCGAGAPDDPTPDVYDQLMERMSQLEAPDWNQNDPTAKDYVKNRTHWVDDDGTVHKLDKKFLPDSSAVSFAAQTLTDAQKAQARENIGAQEWICGEETAEEFVGTGFDGWVKVSDFHAITIPKVELKGTIYENIPVSSESGPTVFYNIGSYSIGFNRMYNHATISPNDGTTGDEFKFYKDITTAIPILEKYVPKEVIFVEFYLNSSNKKVICRKTYTELQELLYKNKYVVVLYSGGEYYWLEHTNYLGGIRFSCPNGRVIIIGSDGNNTWELDNFATESYVKSVALPPVTTADNGKTLKVVDGAWAVVDA